MASSDKIFSLEGKGLKLDTAEDLEPHIAPLRSADVEEVRILGNTLGVGACKLLGEVLATKKNLRVANFADIFTGRLLSEIPDAISSLLTSVLNLPKLNTVNLNDNAFGLNVQAPLVAFLAAHVPLQHLYLNNNGMGPHAGILIADALSELHAKKEAARKEGKEVPDLETVICGRNRLENGSMTAWAKAYKLHNKIKVIKMVQNGIRQEGISHLLAEGLSHASKLEVLDLQDNTFTVTGARALSKVVANWTSLQELGVGDSLLGAKGGVLVADALAKGKNAKLETLRLQYNEITSKGIKAFAIAAKDGLPALKRIEINGNILTEDDESIPVLQELLEERKEKFGGDIVNEDEWGVDELEDLEEPDSDAEEEEEEEEEIVPEDRAEKLIKEAEEAQEEPVIPVKDKEVDELAKKLEKTGI
ncbi:putative ran GTPase activating protein 1 [Fusarium proliferatum ET1]|uniref:Probable ran GTPase activating protein 1 n=1 Tax=Fusarium proliferatum (strain ET1) TaxID=1227346 RepID=A0A1L7V1M7_FUSPR|nr:putative ran GTPase activating protein 1 [Fusarium proliferatum ET1]CZR34817.1 probable ran GTPase activating protein 1 [Fusarium proliferatum ET1]